MNKASKMAFNAICSQWNKMEWNPKTSWDAHLIQFFKEAFKALPNFLRLQNKTFSKVT